MDNVVNAWLDVIDIHRRFDVQSRELGICDIIHMPTDWDVIPRRIDLVLQPGVRPGCANRIHVRIPVASNKYLLFRVFDYGYFELVKLSLLNNNFIRSHSKHPFLRRSLTQFIQFFKK